MTSKNPENVEQARVLVIDFGAQYAQLIARRVREAGVFSEIVAHHLPLSQILAKEPSAIILSGGPASVYEADAPTIDPEIFNSGVPIFGICYGFQLQAQSLGGVVSKTGLSEFGRTALTRKGSSELLDATPQSFNVWMSHGDSVTQVPEGFNVTASTAGAEIAAYENAQTRSAGVQFHPEVLHSEFGQEILRKWLLDIVGLSPTWNMENVISSEVARDRKSTRLNSSHIPLSRMPSSA